MAEAVVSLGKRLRRRRESLGMSQAAAARELDVARTAYRLWEMEAAKPSPDRWRLISRWLGVSVVTLMVAEGLVEDDVGRSAEVITGRFGPGSWEDEAGGEAGGFFEQERSLIARAATEGRLSSLESEELVGLLRKAERAVARRGSEGWRTAELRKELPADRAAPALARAALMIAAAGVPEQTLLDAELLTSDLVSNSVRYGPPDAEAISLHVSVGHDVLRVEVAESWPATPIDPATGRDVALMTTLASRWGGDRSRGGYVTWFEIDLGSPD